MIFLNEKPRICKFCGKQIRREALSVIGHLRINHPDQLDTMKNLYLNDIIKTTLTEDNAK